MPSKAKLFAVGQEFRLLKPAGAILSPKNGVVSIPAGQLLRIKELCDEAGRVLKADWNGQEVFVFREDILARGAVDLQSTVHTGRASRLQAEDLPKGEP